jgi:hypothetical protein
MQWGYKEGKTLMLKRLPGEDEETFAGRQVGALQGIIDEFNKAFLEWKSEFGCEANLDWREKGGRRELSVISIDMPLYKRPPEMPEEYKLDALKEEGKEISRG